MAQNERLQKDISRLETSIRRSTQWSDKAEGKKVGIDPRKVDVKFGWAPKQAAKSKKMMARAKAIQGRQQRSIDEKSALLKNVESSIPLKVVQVPYHAKRLSTLSDISICYGSKTVCEGVSFTIDQGDRICLYGKNGSGKSSLIKLIIGEDVPYTGQFHRGSNLQISYVSQDTGDLRGDLSQYAMGRGIDESLFKAMLRQLDFSRIQFEKDMGDFSGGQKKKVLIAKSICEKKHLLIWDEPLNYIDVLSRIQIEKLLLEYKPTILFVEHDSVFCGRIATKVITL